MRKKILEALKAKFQGVNESILDRISARMAKTVTEESAVQDAVDAYTLQQVIDSYADSRATEATQTAIKNYETKYALKDGEKQQSEDDSTLITEPAGGTDAVPAWAMQLIESNRTLSERLNRMDGERTTASRKQQLQTVYDKLPQALRKPYERIRVDAISDEDFTSLVGEVKTEVDGILRSMGTKGAVFGLPAAHHGGANQGNALTKEQQAAIAHRDAKPADGQPF